MADFHLAQLNVALAKAPMDSPVMADFVARIEEINALAEQSPGFVWRLKDDTDQPGRQLFDADSLVNLSVWESVESLSEFVYRSAHADVMKRRKEWFMKLFQPHMVLWWVPAGHRPDLYAAHDRLEHLRKHGPSAHAFTFGKPWAPTAS